MIFSLARFRKYVKTRKEQSPSSRPSDPGSAALSRKDGAVPRRSGARAFAVALLVACAGAPPAFPASALADEIMSVTRDHLYIGKEAPSGGGSDGGSGAVPPPPPAPGGKEAARREEAPPNLAPEVQVHTLWPAPPYAARPGGIRPGGQRPGHGYPADPARNPGHKPWQYGQQGPPRTWGQGPHGQQGPPRTWGQGPPHQIREQGPRQKPPRTWGQPPSPPGRPPLYQGGRAPLRETQP
ncbi:MAG: hypothetical protein LBD42_01760 [Desulfovibrio sp.]|jgi:hypothetical protein|nr:hypothetical protein [Desulfovibrio sp.]